MFVTGRPWWRFVSYRRNFPPLVIQVNRDEKIIEALAEQLEIFVDMLEQGFNHLCQLNGAPPKHASQPKEKPWYWGAGGVAA